MLNFFKNIFSNINQPSFELLLSELNINPDDYSHEMLEPVFLSFEDKLNGLLLHSTCELSEGKEVYKVDLKDYEDGMNEIEFYYHNCGVEKCANTINKFYSLFGKDINGYEEFNSTDFKLYPQLIITPLRRWRFVNFEIQIGKGSKELNSCFIKCIKHQLKM